MCHILDTFSLIFMTILHFKNVLIGSPEIFIKCPSHRTSKWQNHNLYLDLSGFNALAFSAAALLILFLSWGYENIYFYMLSKRHSNIKVHDFLKLEETVSLLRDNKILYQTLNLISQNGSY